MLLSRSLMRTTNRTERLNRKMDPSIIRIVAGVLAAGVVGVIVYRRKKNISV